MQSGNLLVDPFDTYDQTGSVPPFWTENPGDIDGYWVVTSLHGHESRPA